MELTLLTNLEVARHPKETILVVLRCIHLNSFLILLNLHLVPMTSDTGGLERNSIMMMIHHISSILRRLEQVQSSSVETSFSIYRWKVVESLSLELTYWGRLLFVFRKNALWSNWAFLTLHVRSKIWCGCAKALEEILKPRLYLSSCLKIWSLSTLLQPRPPSRSRFLRSWLKYEAVLVIIILNKVFLVMRVHLATSSLPMH